MDAVQPNHRFGAHIHAVYRHPPEVKAQGEVLGRFDQHALRGKPSGPSLLREVLREAEYLQVRSCGFLEVPSPSIGHRVYRIPSAGGLVTAYEHGCLLMGLCLQPAQPLPLADVIVMHKLLIEANEQAYLQQANHFAPQVFGTPQDVCDLGFWRQTSQPQEENLCCSSPFGILRKASESIKRSSDAFRCA